MGKFLSQIITLVLLAINSAIKTVSRTLFYPLQPTTQILKILIFRKGTIGDHICAFPAYQSLKLQFPNAQFDLLTTPHTQDTGIENLLSEFQFNTIINMPMYTNWQLFLFLKSNKYDAVIELPQNLDTTNTQLRNMIFFSLMGIPKGIGWAVSEINIWRKHQFKYLFFFNEQNRIQSILASYAINVSNIPVLFKGEAIAKTKLPSKYICIAMGAKKQTQKWPYQNFVTLIHELIANQFEVVLVGAKNDANDIDLQKIEGLHNWCGETNLLQSMSIMKHSLLTITNDSGPMHLAYSVNSKLLVLFNARALKGKWFPPQNERTRTIQHYEVTCGGCLLSQCEHHTCMQLITPIDVIKEVFILLNLPDSE